MNIVKAKELVKDLSQIAEGIEVDLGDAVTARDDTEENHSALADDLQQIRDYLEAAEEYQENAANNLQRCADEHSNLSDRLDALCTTITTLRTLLNEFASNECSTEDELEEADCAPSTSTDTSGSDAVDFALIDDHTSRNT